MASVAVTGATGFIGGRLVEALVRRGDTVRALVRKAEDSARIDALGAQSVLGDMADEASLRSLCKGAELLFHLAASRSYWSGDYARQIRLNVGGTARIMSAAHAAGVRRVVFTSSVAAIGVPRGRTPANEEFPFNGGWCPYHYSKWLSEQEAFSWLSRGTEVVAVNPAVVLGSGNMRLDQGTMKVVWDIASGKQKFYPTGGMNLVDVEDVVHGHLVAAELGRPGSRYILGGENLSHRRALGMLAEGFGRRPPPVPAPASLLVMAMLPVEAISRLIGRAPAFTLAHARLSGKFNWFSSARAEKELRYHHRPFRDTVAAMASDLRAKGVL